MTKTSLLSLQTAIFERLYNDTSIQTAGAAVYDAVPQDAPYPYIALGEDTMNRNGTKTYDGEDLTHTLHVFSRYKGKKELKEIMNLVIESLTITDLNINGFDMVWGVCEYMDTVLDADGITRHGVMRFRFQINQ